MHCSIRQNQFNNINHLLAVLLLFGLTGIVSAVEFDLSYSPLSNGNAESGLRGWTANGAVTLGKSSSAGEACFELTPGKGALAELRSEWMPVRRSETICVEYDLKTPAQGFDRESRAAVAVRYYQYDRSFAGESRFELTNTKGQWQHCRQEMVAASDAYFIELVFGLQNTTHADSMALDNIAVYREICYQPLYGKIKPMSEGDTLLVYTMNSRAGGEAIAMQTLQGVAARTTGPRVWIDAGDNTFVDFLTENYGIRFDRRFARDFAAILGELKSCTSGTYVLYDIYDKPSITAATTVAGLLDGVAIDVRLEDAAREKGYTLAADVRGKDCRWVYETYREKLNDDAIIVHTNDLRQHRSAYHLRDWGPALQCLDWWYRDKDTSRAVYRQTAPCSPVYGWQDPTTSDEGLTVKFHSEEGLFQMPSDWMLNLSVHAAMGPVLKEKNFSHQLDRQPPKREKGVHYVTFIMSDMDNILTEIGTNSFYSTRKFYRNSHRGEFPMSWGMAPSLVELSPAGVDMWYRDAKPNEAFVAYCGLGYFYPSVAPYLQTHTQRLEGFLKRADLRTLLLIDRVMPDAELDESYYEKAKWFTGMEQLRGLFYMEYVRYAPHGGRIFWFDGKPMVTARFDFRSEEFYSAVRSSPQALADSINAMPKNPESPDGYTFVTVHAWSKGLDDISEAVKLLGPDVRVVDAEMFINLIRLNLGK